MAHVRSSNGAGTLGRQGRVPVTLEMEALDDLGPQARSVIVNGPISLLAYPVIDQITYRNEAIEQENTSRALAGLPQKPYLNPREPRLDAAIAQALADQHLTVMMRDREPEFCEQGMKVLRPRRNPKTERYERRVRRIRW